MSKRMNQRQRDALWIEGQQPYAYWLDCVHGIGRKTIRRLLEYFGSPGEVYRLPSGELRRCLTDRQAEAVEISRRSWDVEGRYAGLLGAGYRFLPWKHPDYPDKLTRLPDPPYALYVSGRLPEKNIPSVALIGARLCSDYGRYMAREFGSGLARAGIQVISGMARGIDGIGQRAALAAGGVSFGVLGCGIDICYPPENERLYRELMTRGGLLSEYPPGTAVTAGFFPERNRIISGLSDLVLVIEAREKSGSLITVDMALEQGKEVYALPGRVTDSLSRGCNELLKQGAGIAASVEELIQILRETPSAPEGLREEKPGKERPPSAIKESVSGSGEGEPLLSCLGPLPKTVEQLHQDSGIPAAELTARLMDLCLEGRAKRTEGNCFVQITEKI